MVAGKNMTEGDANRGRVAITEDPGHLDDGDKKASHFQCKHRHVGVCRNREP